MRSSIRLVLMLCCLTVLLVGIAESRSAYTARAAAAAGYIRLISKALEAYKGDTGNYPTQSHGLAALCTKPDGIDSSLWCGPYLEELPRDPWGNAYIYGFPGKNNKEGSDLYSLGRDRESATGGNDPDDVNNWDPESGYSYYARLARIQETWHTVITGIVLLLVLAWFISVVVRTIRRVRTKESS